MLRWKYNICHLEMLWGLDPMWMLNVPSVYIHTVHWDEEEAWEYLGAFSYCRVARRLFTAQIIQWLKDLCVQGEGKGHQKLREYAREWLLGDSKEFREACEEANVDPSKVVMATLEILGGGIDLQKILQHQRVRMGERKKVV